MRQIRLFFLFISVAILLTACKNNEIGEQKVDSKNLEYYSQSEVFCLLVLLYRWKMELYL